MSKQSEENFLGVMEDFKDFFNNNTRGEVFDENAFLVFLKDSFNKEPRKDTVPKNIPAQEPLKAGVPKDIPAQEPLKTSVPKDILTIDPQKDSVSFIMEAFKEFYDKNLKDQEFDVKAFMDFMEPKFAEAGYRQGFNPNLIIQKKNMGGG